MAEIVENNNEFQNFLSSVSNRIYVEPLFKNSRAHFAKSELSLIYVYSLDDSGSYFLCFDHYESSSDLSRRHLTLFSKLRSVVFTAKKKELCSLSKEFNHNTYDLRMLHYVATSKDASGLSSSFQSQRPLNGKKVKNDIWQAPLYQIENSCLEKAKEAQKIFKSHTGHLQSKAYYKLNKEAIPAFSELESSGLKVDKEKFFKEFEEKGKKSITSQGLVHPYYNFYTSTGRPSNAYGGINFAALNKEGDSRKSFVSRFKGGRLVAFDFDAFHLRLISSLIDYEFSSNQSVHEELGKIYFSESELSKEQYKESKRQSFKWLYGGIPKKALNYQYFREVQELIDRLWMLYKRYNEIQTPLYKRRIKNINGASPNKVFNYMLQAYETEASIETIKKALKSIKNKDSKLILYTYDSFLFDFPEHEIENVSAVKDDISTSHFPVDGEIGKNYGEMKPF